MAAASPSPAHHPLDIPISDVHRLDEYRPPEWDIEKVDLTFNIIDKTRVEVMAVMKMKRAGQSDEAGEEAPRPLLVLNKGPNPVVQRVMVNGQELSGDQIFIGQNAVVIQPDCDEFTLTTQVTLDPSSNKSGQGIFVTGGIMVTHCESKSCRDITPFIDRPDVMTHWTTTVTAPPSYPVTLSNGNTITVSQDDQGSTRTFKNPFKMPPYLFAMVAGDLKKIEDTHTTKSGRTIKLEIYAAEGFIQDCGLAMAALKKALIWEEERWGVECDLDEYKIVVVEDFNAGAMENKGLNVFSAASASGTQRNRTDAALLHIANVVAHEFGHNVRGNRVGILSFHQIALKEGFTRLTDQMFAEDVMGPSMRVEAVRTLRTKQFPEDSSAKAHPILQREYTGDPMMAQMYNSTAYDKGAEVIRMLHTILGEEDFRAGFKLYLEEFDGKAATLHDLLRTLARPSGMDITQFERWLDQVGTPKVQVEKSYDEATETLTVTFEQNCPKPPHDELHMPCAFQILGPDGKPIPMVVDAGSSTGEVDTQKGILHIRKRTETFTFKNVPKGSVPSFFRGFSAPINIKSNETIEDRRHIMQYETDAFNKVEACEAIVTQDLRKMMARYQSGKAGPITPSEDVMEALEYVIDHVKDDVALATLMLTPLNTMRLVQEDEVYDFEAASAALDAFKKTVAKRFETKWLDLYKKYESSSRKEIFKDGEFHPEVAHERSIKNTALSYLCQLGGKYIDLAKKQFTEATNMSDEEAAFSILKNDPQERANIFKAFAEKWGKDPLAMELFLKNQGLVEAADVLEQVKTCAEDPMLFDLSKPKHVFCLLVRGLIDNHRYAHQLQCDEDGQETAPAYTFIADTAIACPNEYWGARLVKELFSMLPKMDAKRQALMRKELERIAAAENAKKEARAQARKILGMA